MRVVAVVADIDDPGVLLGHQVVGGRIDRLEVQVFQGVGVAQFVGQHGAVLDLDPAIAAARRAAADGVERLRGDQGDGQGVDGPDGVPVGAGLGQIVGVVGGLERRPHERLFPHLKQIAHVGLRFGKGRHACGAPSRHLGIVAVVAILVAEEAEHVPLAIVGPGGRPGRPVAVFGRHALQVRQVDVGIAVGVERGDVFGRKPTGVGAGPEHTQAGGKGVGKQAAALHPAAQVAVPGHGRIRVGADVLIGRVDGEGGRIAAGQGAALVDEFPAVAGALAVGKSQLGRSGAIAQAQGAGLGIVYAGRRGVPHRPIPVAHGVDAHQVVHL